MRSALFAFCLVAAIPACAAPGDSRNWDSLSRVKNLQNVKVHLRDGRVLKGRIQQFGLDGLTLAEEKNWIRVKFGDMTNGSNFARGEAVEIALRKGDVLQGVVQEIDRHDNFLVFAETRAMTAIGRNEVMRVTSKRRGPTALIGAIGGAVLFGIFILRSSDTYGPNESPAPLIGATAGMGAGLGAGVGAAIAWTKTIYDGR